MAKRKKKAAKTELWAARNYDGGGYGGGDIWLYSNKPRLDQTCGECGQNSYWSGKVLDFGREICYSGWSKATGITLEPGTCVQLKVFRVDTP